jgi:hypothetical protein
MPSVSDGIRAWVCSRPPSFRLRLRICAGCASGFHLIDAAFGGLQQRLGPGYDATKCIRPEIIETDIRRAYAPQICPGDS